MCQLCDTCISKTLEKFKGLYLIDIQNDIKYTVYIIQVMYTKSRGRSNLVVIAKLSTKYV